MARKTLLAALFVLSASALQVTPGSSCAAFCLDSSTGDAYSADDSNTTPSDIVCSDEDFWTNSTGTKYRNCLNCLQSSTAVNGSENDASWYLYNVRYALDVCLFGYPNTSFSAASNSPCALENNCLSLQTALQAGDLVPDNETEFQYCTEDNSAFNGTNLNNCMECLKSTTDQVYLSNFLTALEAGCTQQPGAGDLLGLNGTLFSTTSLTVSASLASSTSSPADVNRMSTGSIVGIVIGVVLLLVLGVGLFAFHNYRKKRHGEITHYRLSRAIGSHSDLYDGSPSDMHPLETSEQRLAGITPYAFGPPAPAPAYMAGHSDRVDHAKNLPAHPAYIPHAVVRPSRNSTQETASERSARTDSYHSRSGHDQGPLMSHSVVLTADVARPPPPAYSANEAPPPPPPPPPSQQRRRPPALVLPSVGRLGGKKSYEPPQIVD